MSISPADQEQALYDLLSGEKRGASSIADASIVLYDYRGKADRRVAPIVAREIMESQAAVPRAREDMLFREPPTPAKAKEQLEAAIAAPMPAPVSGPIVAKDEETGEFDTEALLKAAEAEAEAEPAVTAGNHPCVECGKVYQTAPALKAHYTRSGHKPKE